MRKRKEWTESSFQFKHSEHLCLKKFSHYLLSKMCQRGLNAGAEEGRLRQLLFLGPEGKGTKIEKLCCLSVVLSYDTSYMGNASNTSTQRRKE